MRLKSTREGVDFLINFNNFHFCSLVSLSLETFRGLESGLCLLDIPEEYGTTAGGDYLGTRIPEKSLAQSPLAEWAAQPSPGNPVATSFQQSPAIY